MKIERIKFVCPKCGETFDNYEMLSYNSHMAEAAKDFVKNNKPITHCPKCKVKLVNEELLTYFDNNGNFVFETEQLTLPQNNEFDFYCKLINEISRVWSCINFETLTLEGILETIKKENSTSNATHEIVNHILVKAQNGKKEVTLFDIVISKVDYSFGSRYNSFYVEYFTNLNKATLNFLESAINTDLKILKLKIKTVQTVNFENNLKKYSI